MSYILLQSPQDAVIPFQILGGEAQVVQVLMITSQNISCFLSFILLIPSLVPYFFIRYSNTFFLYWSCIDR